ncbi:hypothetical protein ACWCRC_32860 [Streptomyces sp. NPDC001940]
MHWDEIDGPLSAALDGGGELVALLSQGEAQAARYALWLFGQGDGPGSEAAHELALRLERRIRLACPDGAVAVPGVDGEQFGIQ